ncbi:MAG: hypothetical protein EBU06_06030 [Micrococcales bacterium]|nr:hypothetical protein [Micrococcales bacterium]
MAAKRRSKTLLTWATVLLVGSPIFAFSPLALAYLSTPAGGNMWSEGGGGGGSAIWLMFLTIPASLLGLLAGIILLVLGFVELSKEKRR